MEGTSFAIPINRVREIMGDLAEGKAIQHGYLGISLATCTPDWAQKNNALADAPNIPEVRGALVYKVFPMTPAAKGGLKPNDVIVEVNGKSVLTADDTRKLIDAAPIGQVSNACFTHHAVLCCVLLSLTMRRLRILVWLFKGVRIALFLLFNLLILLLDCAK